MISKRLSIALAALVAFAATVPSGSAQLSSSASISNLVPVVTDISVPGLVHPTAGGTTAVPVTVTVADHNGFQDIASVTVSVLKPDGSTIHVAAAPATSNGDGSGVAQTYDHSFSMAFYDDPATGASQYTVKAVATDAAGALSAPLTATFAYSGLAALSLDAATIDFGALEPGTRSASSLLGIANKGNVQIDIDTSGSDLSDGDGHSIDVTRIKYDLAAADFTSESSLTAAPFTNSAFDLAKGASSAKTTWWQLDTPSGDEQYLPAGSYTGAVTISAVQG